MRAFLYPTPPSGAGFLAACRAAVGACGWAEVSTAAESDVALAPLLRRILPAHELEAPRLGTLVFHPSLLPRHRGPDALRQSIAAGDAFGGVSWFWASGGVDAGDVCEQELVALPRGETPREVYERRVIPAGLRSLERALTAITAGFARRVPQAPDVATYESWTSPVAGHGGKGWKSQWS